MSKPGNSRQLVLVAEDDDVLRWTICQIIKDAGMDAVEAGDGRQALTLYLERKPEVVVTDYSMPGLNGGALIDSIKAERADIPVVLITLDLNDDVMINLLHYTRFVGLRKPFKPAELVARVDLAISQG